MLHINYIFYVDGSCKNNPGRNMSYGLILFRNDVFIDGRITIEKDINSTSVIAEMSALNEAFKYIKQKKIDANKNSITIYTDSRTVCDIFNNRCKQLRKNIELVDTIFKNKPEKINILWTKGHKKIVDGNSIIDLLLRSIYLKVVPNNSNNDNNDLSKKKSN